MHTYDFEILQYNEFENLTRDLLQAEFKIYIESFKDGKDGGIDFRYGSIDGGKSIVQVKRYQDWQTLESQLKKEAKKVEKLNPDRYILSTSVALSPANKDTILNIFRPYIKKTEDIYGKDDINNLLGKHAEIETKYYKLWLASTNVLNELLHKNIYNWSKFELSTIREEIKKYVSNESFNKAVKILNKYRYVIISGIPGIGKTTLARMLVYEILAAQNYDEFVYVRNLDDAANLFQEGKKQVFFYDDFLGANSFKEEKGFENQLISFIKAIQREKGKMFILTTREYILAQAKDYYEKLKTNNIEIAKCTIDMGTYSPLIRARILYNHLADAHLPDEYIEQLLQGKNYLNLVNHKNFNPRVIETYIDNNLWQKDSPDKFVLSFIQLFDKPTCVWEKAFNALNPLGQYALLVLGTMPETVTVKDWSTAVKTFCLRTERQLHLTYTDADFQKSMHVLEDCFILIEATPKDNRIVKLYNPSVRGFIVEYLRGLQDVPRLLISGAHYVEQLYSIFTAIPSRTKAGDAYVLLEEDAQLLALERLQEMAEEAFPSCTLSIITPDRYGWQDKILYLYHFVTTYPESHAMIDSWIKPEDFREKHHVLRPRLYFLKNIDWTPDVREEIACELLIHTSDLRDSLEIIETLHEMDMDRLYNDDSYIKQLKSAIDDKIDNELADLADTQSLSSTLEEISAYFPSQKFPLEEYTDRIMMIEDQIMSDIPDDIEAYYETHERYLDNEKQIDEMMTSLRVSD